ncbi:transcriptional regulator, AbrB family [Ferroglobus placidus DSM 10642]|uniref:Transcriptional regulator, AbrB family n=1 Tax=Ferroglobus placidus (strain DSM 10642 / AEDII12DO) TaxID=589924 RepID=D3RZM7_FERPA|nr:AbrB/MazE/SpoVT family DNA-binding domain-containing protein [Ferroglobus placidus]ADC65940.1 transcriptional regulator, AbrB family [Ferroglobus placidus DSM 10642]
MAVKLFNDEILNSYLMVRTRVVGKKGQVTIPKEIRDKLGLKEGEKVVFEIRGDEVIIKPEKKGKDYVDELSNIVKNKLEAPEPEKLKRLLYGEIEDRLH